MGAKRAGIQMTALLGRLYTVVFDISEQKIPGSILDQYITTYLKDFSPVYIKNSIMCPLVALSLYCDFRHRRCRVRFQLKSSIPGQNMSTDSVGYIIAPD